jgi:hypothetical protein
MSEKVRTGVRKGIEIWFSENLKKENGMVIIYLV